MKALHNHDAQKFFLLSIRSHNWPGFNLQTFWWSLPECVGAKSETASYEENPVASTKLGANTKGTKKPAEANQGMSMIKSARHVPR